MIGGFFKAVAQLGDKRISRVILGSLLGTTLLLGLLGWVSTGFLGRLSVSDWGWLDGIVRFVSDIGVFVLILLVFPLFFSLIASLFLETVADAVEDRHFPALPATRGLSILASVWVAVKFSLVVLVLNILVLPLYLIPAINLAVFYGLNGYLLGREYFELVGLRRLDPAAARRLRRANQGALFVAGLIITVLTTIPVVNLLAPVIATAFMTHVFHGLPPAATAHA